MSTEDGGALGSSFMPTQAAAAQATCHWVSKPELLLSSLAQNEPIFGVLLLLLMATMVLLLFLLPGVTLILGVVLILPTGLMVYAFYYRFASYHTRFRFAMVDTRSLFLAFGVGIFSVPLCLALELLTAFLWVLLFPSEVVLALLALDSDDSSGSDEGGDSGTAPSTSSRLPLAGRLGSTIFLRYRPLLSGLLGLLRTTSPVFGRSLPTASSSGRLAADSTTDSDGASDPPSAILVILCAICIAFFSAAFVEELSKYIFTWLFMRRKASTWHPYGGIMHAACIALGFSFIETITYALSAQSTFTSTLLVIAIAAARGVTSLPLHLYSGLWIGWGLVFQRFGPQLYVLDPPIDEFGEHRRLFRLTRAFQWYGLPVLGSFLLHGFFDLFALLSYFSPFMIVLNLLLLLPLPILWHRVQVKSAWDLTVTLKLAPPSVAATPIDILVTFFGIGPRYPYRWIRSSEDQRDSYDELGDELSDLNGTAPTFAQSDSPGRGDSLPQYRPLSSAGDPLHQSSGADSQHRPERMEPDV